MGLEYYYNYDLSQNGRVVHSGRAARDYSTDVLARYGRDFVRTAPAAQPFFLMLTPKPPHKPATPARRHAGAAVPPPTRSPAFDEEDVETVGGLVFSRYGTVPEPGTDVHDEQDGLVFTVDEMDGRRIVSVTVKRLDSAKEAPVESD